MYSHETKIYIAILIAALMLGVILVFFVYTLVKHQRKHARQNQLQIQAEIVAREAERRRIAVDLHDDLGPFLSSMKLQINLLNTQDDEDKELIESLSGQIQEIVQKIRETSNNLLPNVLVRKGLLRALLDFADTINRTGPMKVETLFHPENFHLDKEVEIHLYRICQEAMHNALRHANADVFRLQLDYKPEALQLVIADNGVGFDYATMKKEAIGLGLRNILSRVDYLNGDFFLDAHPGKGVQYTIQIPLTTTQ